MNPLLNGVKNSGVPDPFGSMQNMMSQFQAFRTNPMQYMLQRRLNIPQALMNNPQAAIQYLLNSGAMNQQQLQALQQMARQIQANPQFSQTFGNLK